MNYNNQSYQSIYGVQLLDDIHNYFPDILYNHQRFRNVRDLLNYFQNTTRQSFNLYNIGRTSYMNNMNTTNNMNNMNNTNNAVNSIHSPPSGPARGSSPVNRSTNNPIYPPDIIRSPFNSVFYPPEITPLQQTTNASSTTGPSSRRVINNNLTSSVTGLHSRSTARSQQSTLIGDYFSSSVTPTPPLISTINTIPMNITSSINVDNDIEDEDEDDDNNQIEQGQDIIASNISLLANIANLFNPTGVTNATATIRIPFTSFMEPIPIIPTAQQIQNATSIRTITESVGDTCAICQENIVINDNVRKINICNHSFHTGCIDTWFQRNVRCPVCRHDIRETNPQPSSSAPAPPVASQQQMEEDNTSVQTPTANVENNDNL